MRELMGKLKLTVNEEKTRICKVPEGELDFLGYSVLLQHTVKTKTDLAVNQFCKIHNSKSRRIEPRSGFLARFDHFAEV
jgi:hypothetical protein